MAYRYPPPPLNKVTGECILPSPVPMTNFNIPPPILPPSHPVMVWPLNTYVSHPPPLHLPHHEQTHTDWDHKNVSTEEMVAEKTFITKETPTNDTWLKDWLYRIRKPDINLLGKTTRKLKVFEAKQMLRSCLMKLDKLDGLQKELKTEYSNVSYTCWKEKWDYITEIKEEIKNNLDKLNEPTALYALKTTLQKRSKKRRRQKVQCALHQEKTKEFKVRQQQLHQNIDTWLKNMQEVVENIKREESLKCEADQVLSEVTRKKSEARRQINMLSALLKLRNTRIHTVMNRGQHIDAESNIRFTRVIEHLEKLWVDQLKGYDIEEQGLRVMLDEAVVERTKSEVIQDKQVLAEWETLLFGKRYTTECFYAAAEHDVGAFVAIRKSWDKFVAPPGAVMCSSIPIGWVLPSNPSSDKWESLLITRNDIS
ncbi:programmed cell death protein 7 [Periplaneta americana]|uniref:programmed cell death protein 7 n=1 Tax=Periplaneta americana TaxID=6978 RepID=UPI0037E84F85